MNFIRKGPDLRSKLEAFEPQLDSIAKAKRPDFWEVFRHIEDRTARSKKITEAEDAWQLKENSKKYKAIDADGNCYICDSPYKSNGNYTDTEGRYWVVRKKPEIRI